MMRIIEIVLPVCNLESFLDNSLDSACLIHNILPAALDYALIPPSSAAYDST